MNEMSEKGIKPMPTKAKLYIGCTVATGLALLASGLLQAEFPNLPRYLSYLLLALLASTLKIRLPRMTGTISPTFLFILIGVANFSFSETVTMGCAAAILQSVWRTKQQRKLVHIAFNTATLAISIGVSHWASHFILAAAGANSLPVLLALAACLFLVTNTGLVAGVISLTEEKPLKKVWQHCYSLAFPYYLVGAAIAGLICESNRSAGWKVSLLILPVMYLVYKFYRFYLDRVALEESSSLEKAAAA